MENTQGRKKDEEKPRRKRDYFVTVTLAQIVLSAMLLGLVAMVSPGGNAPLTEKLNYILSTSLTKQELSEVREAIREVIATPDGFWLGGNEETETSAQETTAAEDASDEAVDEPTDNAEETSSAKSDESVASESADSTSENEATEASTSQTDADAETVEASSKSDDENETSTAVDTAEKKADEKAQTNTIGKAASSDATVELIMPVSGSISSTFGARIHPTTGEDSFHSGIDIAASTGTEIKCALDGTVLRTGQSDISGNFIIISHSGEMETRYYHLSKIMVEAGDALQQGDIIGLVGATGRVTGPHLHFEIRIDGERVDPLDLLGNEYSV